MFYQDTQRVYRSSLLEGFSWLEHGFGTRQAGVWVGGPLATLRQVHSAHWLYAHGRTGTIGEADALISDSPGLMIGVWTADCLPVLIADPTHKVVAAIHAGWRGLAAGIAGAVIAGMRRRFDSRPEQLLVAVGPGICGACYEVGPEVAARFAPWLPELGSVQGRLTVDLAVILTRQLLEAGVARQSLDLSRLCTACRPDEFFSYRKGSGRGQRMLSAIGLAHP